jgi:hypothetical protein
MTQAENLQLRNLMDLMSMTKGGLRSRFNRRVSHFCVIISWELRLILARCRPTRPFGPYNQESRHLTRIGHIDPKVYELGARATQLGRDPHLFDAGDIEAIDSVVFATTAESHRSIQTFDTQSTLKDSLWHHKPLYSKELPVDSWYRDGH